MTYPMPPELVDQLGLEPCAAARAECAEGHDVLGWERRAATGAELKARRPIDPTRNGEHGDGR